MKMSASMNGSGKLTVGELCFHLLEVPEDATLNIKTNTDMRDGTAYWSIDATWGEDGNVSSSPLFNLYEHSSGITQQMMNTVNDKE